jgi:hypothetical protein
MKSMLAGGLALGLSSLFATGALACSGPDCLYTPASPGYVFAAPGPRAAPPEPRAYYAPPPSFRGWPPAYAAPRAQPPGYNDYDGPDGDAYDRSYGPAAPAYGPPVGYGRLPPPPVAAGPQANPNYPCLSCAPPPVYAPRPCPQARRPQPYVCLAPEPETVSLRGDLFSGGVGDTGGAYGGGGGWGVYYGGDNFAYSGAAGAKLGAFVASRAAAGGSVSVSASAYASARASAGGRSGGGCKGCGGGKRGGHR